VGVAPPLFIFSPPACYMQPVDLSELLRTVLPSSAAPNKPFTSRSLEKTRGGPGGCHQLGARKAFDLLRLGERQLPYFFPDSPAAGGGAAVGWHTVGQTCGTLGE
jgi:hypothetical protein